MDTLKAEKRSMDVKAKKLRREGFVVGNVYGKAIPGSIPVKMNRMDMERLLKTDNKGSQILLEVDGTIYYVLIKEISFNSMANQVEEVDFQALVSNEKVHSVAEIILTGREKITTGVLQETLNEISYRALPAALVDKIIVDVGMMRNGDIIRVKDLDIAKNGEITLMTDPEAVVATVTTVYNRQEEEAEPVS